MSSKIFQEGILYSNNPLHLTKENYTRIHNSIAQNHAVGFVTGYYDDALTIANISGYFLKNLGYTYDTFMDATSGSLRNLFYGENQTFLEADRFPDIHGNGEGQLLNARNLPVYARLFKDDSVDENGIPFWILSAQIDTMHQNLEMVTHVTQSGFWYIDYDVHGNISEVMFSHDFRLMLGYHDTLEFPNKIEAWSDLLHPEDKEATLNLLESAVQDTTGQTRYLAEYRLKCKDGSYQWFRDSAEIMRDLNGVPSRIVGIILNINQEKQAMLHSQQMDTLFQSVVKLVDRFAICDLKQNFYEFHNLNSANDYPASGSYSLLTERMQTKFKLISKDRTFEQILSPAYIRSRLQTQNDIIRLEYCTNDESQFKTLAITPLLWKGDTLEKVIFIAQDVTQEKQMEIHARQALKDAYEAANRANLAKTEFLSNMSHDIRTPMNAIVGMTAIAGANIDNQTRVLDCLTKITQSSRHLLGLINEVLDMARIESGKISLTEEDFNLSDLMDNVITMVRSSMEQHHHNFHVRISKIEHEDVCGDSLRIQQLLTNILSNAIKYTPEGGDITFYLSELSSDNTDLGCYEFIVQDNGIGMTPEFQDVMFEPFTRADDKRTTNVQGTGLGMAIAQNIAAMMNVHIKVESQPGAGSKFTVTIYLKQRNKIHDKLGKLITLPVLVVDDDQYSCENTVALLKDIGLNGEWVTSGRDAIARTKEYKENQKHFFAIIIDWKMPEMDGIETARQIRKYVGKDVTIIILSAYDYSEIEEEAKAAGVDEFIAKPLFRSRLTAAFQNIINGKSTPDLPINLNHFSTSDYSDKRILLVEDNDLNREIACELLAMTKMEVVTARNGQEAVDLFKNAPDNFYDLIFMDIQMPFMNGYEATAAIRAIGSRYATQIPIVAMTANAFAEDVLLSKNAGMNEHIAKPLDLNKLYLSLEKWL